MAYEQQMSMSSALASPSLNLEAEIARPDTSAISNIKLAPPIDVQKSQAKGIQEQADMGQNMAAITAQNEQTSDHATLSAAIKAGEYNPSDPEAFMHTNTYRNLSESGQTSVMKHAMEKKTSDIAFSEHVSYLSVADQEKLARDLATAQSLYSPIVDAMDADGNVNQDKLEAARQYAKQMASMETVRDPQTGQQKPKYTPEQLTHFDKLEVPEAKQAINMTKYAQDKLEQTRKGNEAAAKIRDTESQAVEREAHAEEYAANAWAKLHPNESEKKNWEQKTVRLDGQPSVVNYDSKSGTYMKGGEIVSEARIQPAEGRGSSLVTGRYNPRTIAAAKDVLNAMNTIDKIPVSVEGAILGTNKTAHTIFSDMSNFAQKKISSESSLNMNAVLADLSRALSITLQMGGKSSEAEVKQLEQYKIEAGIPVSTAQMRLAGATQIVRNSLEAMESTNLPEGQRAEVDDLLNKLKKYPTQMELTEKYYSKSKKPTYGETQPVVKGEAPTTKAQAAPGSSDKAPPQHERKPGVTTWRGYTWMVLPDGTSGWSKQ